MEALIPVAKIVLWLIVGVIGLKIAIALFCLLVALLAAAAHAFSRR